MALAFKSMSTEIKITEVNTFAEAYEAATGQSLRRLLRKRRSLFSPC